MKSNTYDPKEREKEKQLSRDQDAADLASGKITREELREKNSFIKASKAKIDWSRVGSVKSFKKKDRYKMDMNLTENQMRLLKEEASRLNESPMRDGEMLYDFLKRVCAARFANRYIDRDVLAVQSHTVAILFEHGALNYEDIVNEPDHEEGEEVYEWWMVSRWLAERLEEKGEAILEGFDCVYWGRQCTGQSIILDGIMQKIASDYVSEYDVQELYKEFKAKKPFEKDENDE